MRIFLLVGIVFLSLNLGYAQESVSEDTLKIEKLSKRQQKVRSKYYNPKIAAKRSAIIPGWGQIYNDSWWKVPLLYGGLGVSVYFIDFNEDRRNFWLAEADKELALDTPDQNRLRAFRRRADQWRRNRDLVIITMVGIYALQIVDATVDAHLKGFNVDEDLSLNLKPKLGVISNGAPYLGVGITLPIGK